MAKTGIINRSRVVALFCIFAILGVIVLGRMAFLMLFWADENLAKASNQWVRETSVSAQRGNITDRNGEIVAGSASCDMVVIFPATLYEYGDPDFVMEQLAQILEMDIKDVRKKIEANKDRGQIDFQRQISSEQSAAINELLANSSDEDHPDYRKMRGVKLVEDTKRYYPMGDFMTQVLGFTNIDGDGLEGVEARYNKYLTGTDGYVKYEKDGKGLELSGDLNVEEYIAPKDGYNVVLTLDAVIQGFVEKAAEQCLIEQKAASVRCIVMDPNTAEILAMANLPDYDNNDPPRNDTALLNQLTRNGCIADSYEPGSTFKILTTAAALETGNATLSSTYYCPGYRIVDGQKIRCWSYRPHGSQTLTQAVEHSCNPAFMDMALSMGTELFYDKLYELGLGTTTDIGLYGEASGIITASKYVRDVDLARIGFGQSIAVTPIQLITAVSAVINGGNLMQPYVVKEITNAQGQAIQQYQPTVVRENVISEDASRVMRQILQSVVDNGSGRNGAVEGYAVGGKTGTAQKYGEDGTIESGKYISSFCGFAPADDPQVVVLFIVDEPGGSSEYGSIVAAPYVSQILEDTLQYLGVPQSVSVQEDTREVPYVTGMAPELAIAQLEAAGFTAVVEGVGDSVVDQLPAGGETAVQGSTVVLGLENVGDALYDNQVLVPDLAGKTASEAKKALEELGLKMRIRGNGSIVQSQSPVAGSQLYVGDTVTVEFSAEMNPAQTPEPEES